MSQQEIPICLLLRHRGRKKKNQQKQTITFLRRLRNCLTLPLYSIEDVLTLCSKVHVTQTSEAVQEISWFSIQISLALPSQPLSDATLSVSALL